MYKTLKHLRGGPSEFWLSHFLTCKRPHASISHQKSLILVLNCLYGIFLQKSEKKVFHFFAVFGESPRARKIFSAKIFFSKRYSSGISQYFLMKPVANERYLNLAHTNGSESGDFTPGTREINEKCDHAAWSHVSVICRVPKAKSPLSEPLVCAKFKYLSFATGFIKKYWEMPEE